MLPPHARTTGPFDRASRRRDLRRSTDSELLTLLGAGDRQALETLYERHYHDALRFAQRLSYRSGHRSAEDIVSEAIRRVLTALDGGNGPIVGFREYLFTAVRSVSMSPPRSEHHEAPSESLLAGEMPAADESLDGLVVREAFDSLPARWRTALWTVTVTGMKPIELAPLLGLSPNAVAALVKRAREALRIAYVRTYLPRPAELACRRTVEHLARSIVVPLAPGHQLALERHLAGCETCRDAAATLREEVATWALPTDRNGERHFRLADPADGHRPDAVA